VFFYDIDVEWLLIGSYHVYFSSAQQCWVLSLTLSVLVHPFVSISASYCTSPVSCGCFWHQAFSFIHPITIVKNFDWPVAWNCNIDLVDITDLPLVSHSALLCQNTYLEVRDQLLAPVIYCVPLGKQSPALKYPKRILQQFDP
jgi:hypothetical protein